jgi:K+-transporting ATPase KdpF subunit
MSLEFIFALALAIVGTVYLLYAMLRPEHF